MVDILVRRERGLYLIAVCSRLSIVELLYLFRGFPIFQEVLRGKGAE